mmetsp:Transcript_24624/g.97250  ORF Transcript_24624/g.97250 Transcript_24624/m.97250 type:complete len:142 (-) Transcript_24624:922-1347(-)|eukprot:CAMPEP_0113953948 /NCGR_PEP_ID=MMETSP0011_2-20120614/147_1 /TAXON_ID=101924 /ORGANISM="Rhodosorus marinus" /LENGTH=141 /DNA_ID=CAMNT_0000962755 /DNA_START=432 /DNA_END=857 /DNA_ORIENTATION=+ /assembly_acc=CAM_ASM_000156
MEGIGFTVVPAVSGKPSGGCGCTCKRGRVTTQAGLGGLWENLQKKLVRTTGTENDSLEDCPFCNGGTRECDACKGSGKDKLGTCLMCDGKASLMCAVCSGIGKVDIIRRGGTDDRNEFTKKGMLKRKARERGETVAEDETS